MQRLWQDRSHRPNLLDCSPRASPPRGFSLLRLQQPRDQNFSTSAPKTGATTWLATCKRATSVVSPIICYPQSSTLTTYSSLLAHYSWPRGEYPPWCEYKYSYAGSNKIHNEILKRSDSLHAFDVAKAEGDTDAAVAIQRDFIRTWGSVDNANLKNNASFNEQTVAEVERSRRTSAMMRNFEPNFCDHCRKVGHHEDDCLEKYPVLKSDDTWFNSNLDPYLRRIIGIRYLNCNCVHRKELKECPQLSFPP